MLRAGDGSEALSRARGERKGEVRQVAESEGGRKS